MHFDMTDIKAFMSKKVAGIPVGVFVALFAAVILFFALRMKKSTPVTPAADTTPTGDGSQNDPTQQPDFTASPANGGGGGTPTITGPTATSDTNELWKTRSIEWLTAPAQGLSIDVATSAITKYLTSQTLTKTEAAARDMAVAHFGFPPEGIPDPPTDTGTGNDYPTVTDNPPPQDQTNPPNVQPTPQDMAPPLSQLPPTKQGTPPLVHTVRNNFDNSAAELAHLYFGETSNDTVNKIHEVNVNTPGGPGGPWAPGTKVQIPSHINPSYYLATAATRTAPAIASKNWISTAMLHELNPSKNFPVNPGTHVRVK